MLAHIIIVDHDRVDIVSDWALYQRIKTDNRQLISSV
jgi:hypothetical protein